jgi:hypothetical protein
MKSIILVIALLLIPFVPIVNANTNVTDGPLPYCDKVDGQRDVYPGCHDRQDTDEVTGLAPCNDGTQVPDYHDCPDATGMP